MSALDLATKASVNGPCVSDVAFVVLLRARTIVDLPWRHDAGADAGALDPWDHGFYGRKLKE